MQKLSVKAFSLACGFVGGAGMLLMGLIDTASASLDTWGALMATIYLGYQPTVIGSIIGGIWGFICAAVWGALVASLYNKFAK